MEEKEGYQMRKINIQRKKKKLQEEREKVLNVKEKEKILTFQLAGC